MLGGGGAVGQVRDRRRAAAGRRPGGRRVPVRRSPWSAPPRPEPTRSSSTRRRAELTAGISRGLRRPGRRGGRPGLRRRRRGGRALVLGHPGGWSTSAVPPATRRVLLRRRSAAQRLASSATPTTRSPGAAGRGPHRGPRPRRRRPDAGRAPRPAARPRRRGLAGDRRRQRPSGGGEQQLRALPVSLWAEWGPESPRAGRDSAAQRWPGTAPGRGMWPLLAPSGARRVPRRPGDSAAQQWPGTAPGRGAIRQDRRSIVDAPRVPPPTATASPVTAALRGDARNVMTSATSSAVTSRPMSCPRASCAVSSATDVPSRAPGRPAAAAGPRSRSSPGAPPSR